MDVFEAIQNRTSVRDYTSEVPDSQLLTKVVEAGRLAPSACNRQPWHFYVVTSEAVLEELYASYGRDWLRSAKAIIVVVGNHAESWHRSMDGKDHCDVDVSIAVDHMTLAAQALGLSTCWICNFDAPAVAKTLSISAEQEAIAMLPIGFAASAGNKKVRKALEEVATFI